MALALLVAVVPLAIFEAISAKRTASSLLDTHASKLQSTSILIAKAIERHNDERLLETRQLALAGIFQSGNYIQIKNYLLEISSNNKSIKEIAIIGIDGKIKMSSHKNNKAGQLAWNEKPGIKELFFATVHGISKEVYVTEAHFSDTGLEILYMTAIRNYANNRVTGVLLLENNIIGVQEVIANFSNENTSGEQIYVVNNMGNIMLTTNPAAPIFSPLLDVRDQPAMLSDNVAGSVVYIDPNGIDVMSGYKDTTEFGANNALDWSVITVAPTELIGKSAQDTRSVLTLVGILVAAVTVFVAYYFARSITSPLQHTVALAEEIRSGNYSKRLESSIGGEIGLLANAINEMADRVEERTAEIIRHNEKLTSEIIERKIAQDRLSKLSHKIVRLQEEERKRVSRELHDGINQLLVSIKYKIENFEEKFGLSEGNAIKDVNTAVVLLGEAIAEVRRVSHALRPSVLDDLGLMPAISNLVGQFSERNAVSVALEGDDLEVFDRLRLPVDVETAMYRIVQEALTNIEKHSKADKVTLNMSCTNSDVTIRIEDNGDGFNLQKAMSGAHATQSLGLRNMRERIELIQGSFYIHSDIGKGTFLEINAPLSV
jgi:signal transduction histidine kinase